MEAAVETLEVILFHRRT